MPQKEFEKQYLQLEEEDKITQNDVDSFIEEIKTIKMGDKTTVTQTICKNGFIITDASTCVNAKISIWKLVNNVVLNVLRIKFGNI